MKMCVNGLLSRVEGAVAVVCGGVISVGIKLGGILKVGVYFFSALLCEVIPSERLRCVEGLTMFVWSMHSIVRS